MIYLLKGRGIPLKTRSAILIVLIISSIYIYSLNQGIIRNFISEPTSISNSFEEDGLRELEGMKTQTSNKQSLPSQGLLTYVGMTAKEVEEILGKPNRIDRSPYDYDWWIYNENLEEYLQIGVEQNKVVTVYGIGESINISPFHIGQAYSQVATQFSIDNQLSFNARFSSFRFELNEVEMKTRPLIEMDDVYIQLYFDTFTNNLSSIRYMDKETLVKHRPYELVYRGDLLSSKELTNDDWREVEEGTAAQILDLTNIIRYRHGINPVQWDDKTSIVAYNHSKEMNLEDYFSHQSPNTGGLADRLVEGEVPYQLAGENIAARYVDGIAAVEGWLNSEGHRDTLLNGKFTHLGVGVFEKHYTQNFIQKWEHE